MSKYAINPGTYKYPHPCNEEWLITDKITWKRPPSFKQVRGQKKIWFRDSVGGREYYCVRTITGKDVTNDSDNLTGDVW